MSDELRAYIKSRRDHLLAAWFRLEKLQATLGAFNQSFEQRLPHPEHLSPVPKGEDENQADSLYQTYQAATKKSQQMSTIITKFEEVSQMSTADNALEAAMKVQKL